MVLSVVCVFLVASFVLTETQLPNDTGYQWLTIALPQEKKCLKLEDRDVYDSTMGSSVLLLCSKAGKAVPLQAWSGPEGSRKLRCPDFTTPAQDGGKVVSLTHRPPLPPGNTSGTHFC